MSDLQSQLIPDCHRYFVDEAGDGTLFDKHGRSLVGTDGCSKYFILDSIGISSASRLDAELDALRAELLADAYFKGVPSFEPSRERMHRAFHAKDDLPEVRREVFKLLAGHSLHFHAVIRDKNRLLVQTLTRNKREPSYRYNPNDLYDSMVHRLFRTKLHRNPCYEVWFARRGKSNRTEALRAALDSCRSRYLEHNNRETTATFTVNAGYSHQNAAFQATDYMLWALQRRYERGEDRYFEYVSANVSLVEDADDTRRSNAGAHYSRKKRPLTLTALQGRPGI